MTNKSLSKLITIFIYYRWEMPLFDETKTP